MTSDLTQAVLDRIQELMDLRGWTIYRLAEVCDIQHSSLYNLFSRHTLPRIDTLERICNGMDITLCDFFAFTANDNDCVHLTDDERRLIEIRRCLKEDRSSRLNSFAQGMLESQQLDK